MLKLNCEQKKANHEVNVLDVASNNFDIRTSPLSTKYDTEKISMAFIIAHVDSKRMWKSRTDGRGEKSESQ